MLRVAGRVWIRKNGVLVASGKNLVVTTGEGLIAKLIGGTGTPVSHMAIGNSGAATLASMTALQGTELERVALDSTTVSAGSVSYEATFGSGISVSVTVREVALLNAVAGGEMLARFICSGFGLSAGESANITWALSVAQE